MLNRFHPIPERYVIDRQTDRQTDGQTDGHICYIKSRVNMLTRDKNCTLDTS